MTIFLIALLVILVFFVIIAYNGLVTGRQQVREAWSNIDTHLKRRYNLIPNLIETAKGYMKYEKETFEAIVKARNTAISASGVEDKAAAENQLGSALKSLFSLTEAYPELKANENFLTLQQELADTENKIQAARSFYNSTVLSQNTLIEKFPSNLIAKQFGFTQNNFFELDNDEKEAVRKAPKVFF